MGRSYNYETTEILRVIDGDTVVASVDLGFETFRKMNIRLKGIDAPELRNFHTRITANASRLYLEELLPQGTIVKFECTGTDKYGRWLGVLFKDDMNINNEMLIAGHAVVMDN